MPKYWMITNRNVETDGLGIKLAKDLAFFTSDNPATDQLAHWTKRTAKQFKDELLAAAEKFP
ncbi:MAG: hypothetical protein HZA89_12640, partial [Verrucomicrobia bacterium]|nr:hypothetical protein [Verrucomicrobiota bacterium]